MSSAMAGTRLAAVANQRRQQRKQLKNAATETNNTAKGKEMNTVDPQQTIGLSRAPTASTFDDSTVSSHGSFFSASTGTSKENKGGKYQHKLGLKCTTTESTTFEFDESTVSSAGEWSSEKMSRGNNVTTTPPMMILSPSNRSNVINKTSYANANISSRLRTSKLRVGRTLPNSPEVTSVPSNSKIGTASSNSSAVSSTIPNSRVGRTSSNSSVASSTISKNSTMHQCKTPKRSNSKQPPNRDTSAVSFAVTTTSSQTKDQMRRLTQERETAQDQIRRLTLEREHLQSDVAQYKRKLQKATDSNTKNINAKDDIIVALEDRIESLAAELEQKEGEALMATLQSREMEKLVAEDGERKSSLHRKELKAVQSELDATMEELARAKRLNNELITEKESLESKGNELCKVLQQVQEERSNMKSRVTQYSEQLSKVQMECEEKVARYTQNQGQLEKSLQAVQNEKRSILAESKQQLSSLESQLSKALADKREAEQMLQNQILDLQNELQMQRNLHENFFSHQSKIVEALKSDLAKSIDIRKESVRMKQEYEAHKAQSEREIENLRSQLRSTQSESEDKMQTAEKEKELLVQQLAQAVKDIDSIKLNRKKDIQFLESELDQTTKDKVEIEQELIETKRQLQNAMRKMEEMEWDGGKMKHLESKVDDLTNQKSHYLKEISDWKKVSEEHRCQIKDLKRDNDQYEVENNALQMKVASLEERLGQSEKHDESGLVHHIEYLKEKLQLAKEEAMKATTTVANDEYNAKIMQLENEKLDLYSQVAQQKESMEQLRTTHHEMMLELSRAQQKIQVQKSKETYLESRLDSLANQISKTVLAYEMKLSSSGRASK